MDSTERRIRAAMTIGGVDSFVHLAGLIDRRGFGEATLRRLKATGDTRATSHHLKPIADACGVPYEFFTTPADELGRPAAASSPSAERLDALEARIVVLETAADVQTAQTQSPKTDRLPGAQQQ